MADRLSLDAAAAIKAGMSYGNYKALHPHTDGTMPDFRRKVTLSTCPYCGTLFEKTNKKQIYCNAGCGLQRGFERNRAKKKQAKEQAGK